MTMDGPLEDAPGPGAHDELGELFELPRAPDADAKGLGDGKDSLRHASSGLNRPSTCSQIQYLQMSLSKLGS